LQVATPTGHEIELRRSFAAPRGDVFDAHVRPDLVKRWMIGMEGMSMPVCEMDAREGGSLRFVWRTPDGNDMGVSGRFQAVDRPARLVHTELFDMDWTGGETLVTTSFEGVDSGCTMTMTIRYATKEARDAVLATGMVQGITACYDRLDTMLAGRRAEA
jgi:uncharacterized protein YndB with AHSA1/START domain